MRKEIVAPGPAMRPERAELAGQHPFTFAGISRPGSSGPATSTAVTLKTAYRLISLWTAPHLLRDRLADRLAVRQLAFTHDRPLLSGVIHAGAA